MGLFFGNGVRGQEDQKKKGLTYARSGGLRKELPGQGGFKPSHGKDLRPVKGLDLTPRQLVQAHISQQHCRRSVQRKPQAPFYRSSLTSAPPAKEVDRLEIETPQANPKSLRILKREFQTLLLYSRFSLTPKNLSRKKYIRMLSLSLWLFLSLKIHELFPVDCILVRAKFYPVLANHLRKKPS